MTINVGDVVKYSKTYLDAAAARNWGPRRLGEAVARRGTVVAVRELNVGWITVATGKRVIHWRTLAYVQWGSQGNNWVVEWADNLAVVSGGN